MEELTRAACLRLVDESLVAHLGVIDRGDPYVTPMSFVRDGERVLFRTMPGRKLEALRGNPNVCIEVSTFDEETGAWASVIIKGHAREVPDAETRQTVVDGLFRRYAKAMGDPLDRGGLQALPGWSNVIEVVMEEVTGMSSGGGLSARTKPGRF